MSAGTQTSWAVPTSFEFVSVLATLVARVLFTRGAGGLFLAGPLDVLQQKSPVRVERGTPVEFPMMDSLAYKLPCTIAPIIFRKGSDLSPSKNRNCNENTRQCIHVAS